MTDRDSAFLWETEMLRTTSRSHTPRGDRASALIDGSDWLTLKEASDLTGVPAGTIRKWARHENIPSYLEKTDDGHLRIVSLEGMRRWAAEIGRELESNEIDDGEDVTVDLTPAEEPTEPGPAEASVPEGSMLVPLDAWNKMLNQLGNLHEAGQQLADARERAAKAETEARFLKERLAEMRSELEKTREIESPGDEDIDEEHETPTARPTTTIGGTAVSVARKFYDSWRERRRG